MDGFRLNRTLTIDAQTCTGCGDCRRACAEQLRDRPDYSGEIVSRVRVFGEGPLFWLALCRQCADAPCADACISGALQVNRANDRVELNSEVCVGCGMCVMVCPFGAIWLEVQRAKSYKCDLCPTQEGLPCVAACKPGALRVDGISLFARDKRRRATESIMTPDRRLERGREQTDSGAVG